jgi:CDP-4-dehydro-6-deoxyglucose reductase, E1
MDSEKILRREIFERVKKISALRKKQEIFKPGKSPVNYAGRLYDAEDMIHAVDASLDFWLTAGRYAQQFEKEFAEFVGVKHCLLTNSGSSANLLAVTALTSPLLKDRRLKPGGEVITTACGFPTTLNPILQNNLVPVFVDVELGTYNIRPDLLEKAISPKTKAIFVAHTLGNPANLSLLQKAAKKHGLWYLEDNCDALGSVYGGRMTGTFGDIATCSFYPAHHMTMGEGGALLTDNALLRRCILSFRDWGRDCWCEPGHDDTCRNRFNWKLGGLPHGYDHKYIYSHIGYNLKVTDIQAAIGVSQMKKLPRFIQARRKNFAALEKIFSPYAAHLLLPRATSKSEPSWFGFPVLVKDRAPFSRGEIVQHLEDHRVATRMLFGGNLIKQPAYARSKYRVSGTLENTDKVMNQLFWIGVYPGITAEKLKYIDKVLKAFMDQHPIS